VPVQSHDYFDGQISSGANSASEIPLPQRKPM